MVCLVLAFLALSLSPTSAKDAKAAARALESRYAHARTLKAEFFERYSDGNGAAQSESGTVYFSRPGRMRWDYESPEKKLFLVDGANVWFYVPVDRTASRAKMKESSDWRTPIALLAGKADLARLCSNLEIVDATSAAGVRNDDRPEVRPAEAGNTVLRCTPRKNSNESGAANDGIREVLLETDPQAHLVRVTIREAGNLETEFRFGNWEENIPIPEAQFHFQPPAGVAVVDEATLAGAIH
jgi:outer membrane lipoprotein carrier protein